MGKRLVIQSTSDNAWVSATDLMSGLMVLFLFIAVAYMINASQERDQMRNVALDWARVQDNIYEALLVEFRSDLPKWNAMIERESLIVRFREPTVLFDQGKCTLKPEFQNILSDFFPRYVQVLRPFALDISEVRIEGHTSPEWNGVGSAYEAYSMNMVLSHDRTRNVLIYCLSKVDNVTNANWARSLLVASGFSSSKPIIKGDAIDWTASRRVEFRVRTNAEEKLSAILEQASLGQGALIPNSE